MKRLPSTGHTIRRRFFLLVGSVCASLAVSCASHAHLPKVVKQTGTAVVGSTAQNYLTLDQAKTFQSALRAVSERAHICVLAEAAPLKDTLTDKQAQPLVDAATYDETLFRIAEAYDYRMEKWYGRNEENGAKARSGAAPVVYLLHKKYTDANDLPDVTFEEYRLLFNEAAALAKPFNLPPALSSHTGIMRHVATVLSPEQIQQVVVGNGIPIKEMRSEQQNAVGQLVLYTYVGSLEWLEWPASFLDKAVDQGVVVQENMPPHPYVLQWKLGTPMYAVTLPNEKNDDIFFKFVPCCSVVPFGSEVTGERDSAKNGKTSVISKATPAFVPATLGTIVEEYARRAPDFQIGLDAALRDRSVSQFGSAFASPIQQMYALAVLLDLQVQHRTETEYQFGRPRLRDPREVSQLSPTIRGNVLPGSLRHYFLDLSAEEARAPNATGPQQFTDEGFPVPTPQQIQSKKWNDRRERVNYATNKLRENMRPALREALSQVKDISVPLKFSALNAKTRAQFGLLWTLDRLMPNLLLLPMETPPYVTGFRHLNLKAEWRGKDPNRTLYFFLAPPN